MSVTLRNILFVSHKCCSLQSHIEDLLTKEGFVFEKLELDHLMRVPKNSIQRIFLFLRLLAEIMKRENIRVILCSPLGSSLYLAIAMMLFVKPKKIVFIISPSSEHTEGFLHNLGLYITRFVLSLMGILGVKYMYIFTTPYETIAAWNIVGNEEYVFAPIYKSKYIKVREPLHSEKPTILFYYKGMSGELARNIISALNELGLTARLLIISDEENISCPRDPRTVCIIGDETDNLVEHATLLVVGTPDFYGNKLIAEAIMHGRPLITTPRAGLARVYIDTGFISYEELWNTDTIVNKILKILNEIDKYKRLNLAVIPDELRYEYGIEIIKSFLS